MNDTPNSKEVLKDSFRIMVNEVLNACVETIQIEDLDSETYNLCDDLIKATLRFYRHRRNTEEFDD